jgi:hypothetical protein
MRRFTAASTKLVPSLWYLLVTQIAGIDGIVYLFSIPPSSLIDDPADGLFEVAHPKLVKQFVQHKVYLN